MSSYSTTQQHTNNKISHTETAKEYLDRHELPTLFQQAITLCIQQKTNEKKSLQIVSQFFDSLLTHRHACFLPFKQVNATRHTRLSFITSIYDIYSSIPHDTYMTPETIYQYITCICYDFPYSLIRNASRITQDVGVTGGDSGNETWSQLLRKICILFYYSEFMNQAALSFRTLDRDSSGHVSRSSFTHQLLAVITHKSAQFPCPSKDIVETVLHGDGQIMFNAFCVQLFKHAHIMPQTQIHKHSNSDTVKETSLEPT